MWLCVTVCVQELEKEWEHQQGEEHILRSQLKRLQDDLRRVNRHLEKEQKEKNNLEEKIGKSMSKSCID